MTTVLSDCIHVTVNSEPVISTVVSPSLDMKAIVGLQGNYNITSNVVYMVAGEILGGHRVVIRGDDGKAYYASNSNLSHAFRIIGVTSNASVAGDYVEVRYFGEIKENSWDWEMGKPIFLGDSGILTQIPPSGGFVYIAGIPIDSKTMLVMLDRKPIFIGG